jgi:Ser/Thr protein kinase RdoA (MazF antagonist)
MNDTAHPKGFSGLGPDLIISAVEAHLGVFLDGMVTPYNSYVNRVFGLADEDGNHFIAKFYRPGRWTTEAIAEEHAFLADCAEAEVPVVPPIASREGSTLGVVEGFRFAVFPRVRARTFDIAGDEDYERLGRAVGRIHRAGQARSAPHRLRCAPESTTARYVRDIENDGLVHPDCRAEFAECCEEALAIVSDRFSSVGSAATHRIHGDLHRGNVLDSGSLTILDFDDMMTGPAVQDLWMLLPGQLADSRREMNLLLDGYEEFADFDRATLSLVEPLRFMRHLYFLAWCAIQRNDEGFAERFPGWGGRAFWITETEDLRAQLAILRGE